MKKFKVHILHKGERVNGLITWADRGKLVKVDVELKACVPDRQ